MARKLCKIVTETNMFGTQVQLKVNKETITLMERSEQDWSQHIQSLPEGFWMRSPECDVQDLQATAQVLAGLSHPFEFKVWRSDHKWDAHLKLQDESDAAMVAWSLNGIWCKWTSQEEKEFRAALKPRKPLKVVMDDQGNMTIQGKVKVNSVHLSDS